MAIEVETAERIAVDDQYDIALVTVRRDQLASAVPELKASRFIPNLLFMLNNPTGAEFLAKRWVATARCSVSPVLAELAIDMSFTTLSFRNNRRRSARWTGNQALVFARSEQP